MSVYIPEGKQLDFIDLPGKRDESDIPMSGMLAVISPLGTLQGAHGMQPRCAA